MSIWGTFKCAMQNPTTDYFLVEPIYHKGMIINHVISLVLSLWKILKGSV